MRLSQKYLWVHYQENNQRVPQLNIQKQGGITLQQTQLRLQQIKNLLPQQNRKDHRAKPCSQPLHRKRRILETNEGSIQIVLHLVHQRKIPEILDSRGKDGAERSIYRVQEHCSDVTHQQNIAHG